MPFLLEFFANVSPWLSQRLEEKINLVVTLKSPKET